MPFASTRMSKKFVEHLRIGEDLVDFLDVDGGGVQGVAGFGNVGESEGVASCGSMEMVIGGGWEGKEGRDGGVGYVGCE
ncbi:hypothetical protein PIB30_031298 [Stylosanthes scabra]|uniref:Uncharacterized protein n=1 Tax=Stylosanthes scabra TaxID=79078 RepID=A0ABU6QCL5_9FABA|nr:hypothetical protein [Stylosanthes scabra]